MPRFQVRELMTVMVKTYIISSAPTLQLEASQITITPSTRQRGEPLTVNLKLYLSGSSNLWYLAGDL